MQILILVMSPSSIEACNLVIALNPMALSSNLLRLRNYFVFTVYIEGCYRCTLSKSKMYKLLKSVVQAPAQLCG